MGSIQSAMQAGVSGLRANSEAVGSISENIANSSTIGYKKSFEQMVTTVAGDTAGVTTNSRTDIETSGALVGTNSGTDLAVDGEGFMVVMIDPESTDASNFLLTRAGSFEEDADGYLVNAAGYYLAGYSYDDDGALTGIDRNSYNSLEAVNVSETSMLAEASSEASVQGNLPSSLTGTGSTISPFISSMSYYSPLGEMDSLSLSWTPSDTTDNLWTVEVADNDGVVYGTVDIEFNDSGALAGTPASYTGTVDPSLAAPAGFAVDADGNITLTIDNGATPQTLSLSLGGVGTYDGLTQFDGDYEPQTFSVDGTSTAALETTEIDDSGNVVGIYDNGNRVYLYQVPVATVDSANGLDAVTGNAYKLSLESGDAVMNVAGSGAGSILSYATESSNVDIAEEMTDLITVQRAYSSNASIITTADEMLQEVNNLKR